MKGPICLLSWITLLLIGIGQTTYAGEVITREHMSWAADALNSESALDNVNTSDALAVLYFHNQTDQSFLNPLQKGLTYMLITDLSQLNQIKLIERVRLQALLKEMDLSISKLLDPDQKPRVGRLLKANYVVGGQLIGLENEEFKVTSDLLDISKEKSLGTPSSKGKVEEIVRIEKELLFKIIRLLKIELSSDEKNRINRPLSGSLDALMAFFHGLEESDGGNYEKAADFYEKAIKEDPEFKSAQKALSELVSRKLVVRRKKSQILLHSLRKKISLTQTLSPSQPTVQRPATSPSTTRVVIGWD